ncbi:MAG: hypothetical protein GY948_10765 [Alphaproteobacteria bacterium]|nr:hypothetical protein [Alphaproteobacteria bacterium]
MFGLLKSAFVAAALLLAAFASPNIAEARSFCAPRDNIVKILDKRFSEKRQAIGLANQKGLVELYVSAGGTWSMVRTNVQGVSCVIASGHAWEQAPLATLLPGA